MRGRTGDLLRPLARFLGDRQAVKEEQRREARVARARLSWRERWDFNLESLSERERVAIVLGTALAVVAAVAMLVIGAFVDLPWM
jgi:hypothetical protein